MAKRKKQPTTDGLEIIYRRFYEGRPRRIAQLKKAIAEDEVARKNRQRRASR